MKIDSYHFIGIGGIGMSALAEVLLQRGSTVQGSDLRRTFITKRLEKMGARLLNTVSEENLHPYHTVVFNSAIPHGNPEYELAIRQGLSILHRSQLLDELMKKHKTLLVAGSHGKTTVTSLIAHLLHEAELHPSFAIGGIPLNFGFNGSHATGEYFVAEADESDGSFFNYKTIHTAILTNIGNDHLNYWETNENLVQAFGTFASKAKHLWWCADDEKLSTLSLKGKSYGFTHQADLHITRWQQTGWKVIFDLVYEHITYRNIELPLIGKHNVLNGAAVFGIALQLGIEVSKIRKSFQNFKGVHRRMEWVGNQGKVSFYDDYAHHPNEIASTLHAFRKAMKEHRIVVIFEPHRFSRLRCCWKQFLSSMEEADMVLTTDVYSAGEPPISEINSQTFHAALSEMMPFPVHLIPKEEFFSTVPHLLRPHDRVIAFGAGDLSDMVRKLVEIEIPPFKVALCHGGRSGEHEVSLASSKYVQSLFDSSYYKLFPFTLSKQEGKWKDDLDKTESWPEIIKKITSCDFAAPILHGPYGEDGTLQGFFETLSIPYLGSDFRACALAMDKGLSKQIAAQQGISIAPYLLFSVDEWKTERHPILSRILGNLPFPLYVKPNHLGSSIEIYLVTDVETLIQAIESVLQVDYQCLVEKSIPGREFQFGCAGYLEVVVSNPCEIKTEGVYSYEDKYLTGKTLFEMSKVAESVLNEGKRAAETIYKAFHCSGCARIDFFLYDTHQWIFHEINPMPGLTKTSTYLYMWKHSGLSEEEILDRIVISSLYRYRTQTHRLSPCKSH